MAVLSTIPTSRRGYLSQDELEQFANITVTDSTEADDQISQAEELIDAWVGPQDSFIKNDRTGLASAGGATTITLESVHQNNYDADYFKWCYVEILGGTGLGQRRKVASSTKAGILTVEDTWTTNPDATSFYKLYQMAKFPRVKDVKGYNASGVITYYKSIPEPIRRGVAAQVEYVINMGEDFFKTDKTDKQAESIGDYSYELGGGAAGMAGLSRMIAPKAKLLLRGYKVRIGQITI